MFIDVDKGSDSLRVFIDNHIVFEVTTRRRGGRISCLAREIGKEEPSCKMYSKPFDNNNYYAFSMKYIRLIFFFGASIY